MKNLNFLVAAYVAIWAVFFVFLFSVARRVARLQEEIRKLKSGATRDIAPPDRGIEKIPTVR